MNEIRIGTTTVTTLWFMMKYYKSIYSVYISPNYKKINLRCFSCYYFSCKDKEMGPNNLRLDMIKFRLHDPIN